MAKKIDAELKNILGVFSNNRESILGRDGVFIIPEYQRAYNWTSYEQCDKLRQDIEAFIDNRDNDSYFLGSIIINNANDVLYVIDGQQRLTTFMLLLKALLLRINAVLDNMPVDSDTEKVKNALENRRKEIITCLYLVDEDEASLLINESEKFLEAKVKYKNKSINEEEEYKRDVRKILKYSSFEEIEKNVKKKSIGEKIISILTFLETLSFFGKSLVDLIQPD